MRMFNRSTIYSLMQIIVVCAALSSIAQTAKTDSLEFNGNYYPFIVYTPADLPSHPPLVLVIHGVQMPASMMRNYSHFDEVADREKILVVYPNAINNSWTQADVEFLSMLIDTIANRFDVDRNRMYSTGFSQGGYMSHDLGAKHADKIAAIAPVSGLLPNLNIKPARPMPVLHIHGTTDDIVPYSGAPATIQAWVEANGCPETPVTTDPYPPTDENSKTIKEYYGPCDQNSEIIFLKMGGIGHAWATGGTNYDINANDEIWAFFENHTLNTTAVISPASPEKHPASARYEHGFLAVRTMEPVDRINCLDISGRVIGCWSAKAGNVKNGKTMIKTNLTPGMYLLQCTGKITTQTVSIVVLSGG